MFNTAAAEKRKKYEPMRKAHACTFIPLVFEAFGGFSHTVDELIKRLKNADGQGGDSIRQDTNGSIILWMRRKISVAIHRFNAMAMIKGAIESRQAR